MTTFSGYSGGENTTIGIAEAWKPGDVTDPKRWIAPTQFLMIEQDDLQSDVGHVERMVLGAGVDSDLGHRTGKVKNTGPMKLGLFPNNGLDLLVGAVGNNSAVAAGSTVTSTGVATANNRTTFTVGSSAGFVVGQPYTIDTAVSGIQEVLQLIDKTTTTLVFGQTFNTHGATTDITQEGVDLIAPYTRASGYGNLLRMYALEESPGLKYVNRYSGIMMNKWGLNAQASKFDVTVDMVASAPRKQDPSFVPTDLDETAPDWGELGFEFTDGFMAFPFDVNNTGTSVVQLVGDGLEWSIDLDNHMREIPAFDNTDAFRYFRGNRTVELKYKILNGADRPVGYTDFVKRNINVPWFSQVVLNTGTATAPKWQGLFFYAPHVRYLVSQEIKNGNEVVGEQVTVRALKAAGAEKLYIYRLVTA